MKEYIFENRHFCLKVGEDAIAYSLISKSDGVECLADGLRLPLFSVTEDRPFNNELKLMYMNKRTTFEANRLRQEGDRLIVGFELLHFEAVIEVKVKEEYITFTLVDYLFDPKDFNLTMDLPPVEAFCLLQLPANRSLPYGQWLNVCHNERSVFAVVATDINGFVGSSTLGGYRVLSCEARRKFHSRGCTAALVCTAKEEFLDVFACLEEDYDLPRGVKSRRDPLINASIYWTNKLNPENVDEHIAYAKKGGYRMMLLYYTCMAAYGKGYGSCGDYTYKASYPNGDADMKAVLQKIKAAGITPGLHVLHTHIGFETKYVTPRADHRLHLIDRFTLSRPLAVSDDVVYVEECPIDAPKTDECRVLRFDGELIHYESYSTERPYCFKGCKRGYLNTEISAHEKGTSGGVLHINEYGSTSVYIDQDTDLQDEVAAKIAHLYDLGFEFLYYDGSEGTHPPYDYHIPNAQYRVYKALAKPPVFCEGAAKAHFGWHILSGANAFDVFPTPIFKEKILEYPFHEAGLMRLDFSRVNFGWWKFYRDTRVDVHEFGTSKAAAWDCPVTVQINLLDLHANPRTEDILEMMSRWEDVRARGWLTAEQKEQIIREERQEFTLLRLPSGEYELLPYAQVPFEEYQGVTAFVFERDAEAYVVLWDDLGSSRVTLNSNALDDVSATLGGYAPEMEQREGNTVLRLSRRSYLKSSMTKDALVDLVRNSKIERIEKVE